MGSTNELKLNINIIGAGVAGLASAISLSRKGHNVVVLEANPELSEFGAGIQMFSNAVRVVSGWGLAKQFKAVSNEPPVMRLCRWQDGRIVGENPHNPLSTYMYDYPNYTIYRPDLQRVLYEAALAEGAVVRFGMKVVQVDTEKGVITMEDGQKMEGDLVLAGDGIGSRIRACLPETAQVHVTPHTDHCYRMIIPKEAMDKDPETAHLMSSHLSMVWLGPHNAILGYPVASGELYNFLIDIPRPNSNAPVDKWNSPGDLGEMRALVDGWCPVVQKLVNLVDSCTVWTLGSVKTDTYVSKTGRFALIGDAAHAITPHAGQGAAMALEDAAALGEFLGAIDSAESLPKALDGWWNFRQDRVERIRKVASGNADWLKLPDGPEQEARDKGLTAMTAAWKSEREELGEEGYKAKLQKEKPEPDPNGIAFASPNVRMYSHGYDVVGEAQKYIAANL